MDSGFRTLSRTAEPTDGRPGDRVGGEKDETRTGSLYQDVRVWVDFLKKRPHRCWTSRLSPRGVLLYSLNTLPPPPLPPTGFLRPRLRSSAEAFLSMNYARVNTLALDATLLLTASSLSQ